MSRLIDADALHKRIKAKNTSNAMMRVMKAECLAEIDDAPTIEPERKTGRWIYEEVIHGHCSCCGFLAIYQETDVFGYDFCPNCGADMRGEQNED